MGVQIVYVGSPRRENFLVWGGVKNFKKIVFPPSLFGTPEYLVRTFTKHQPVPLQNPSHNSPDSHYYANDVRYGPSNAYTCYSEAAGGVPFQNNPPQMMSQKEVPTTMDPIITNAYTHPLHLAPNYPPPPLLQQPPVQQIHRPKVDISVADMMEALASVVAVHLSNKPSG